MLGRVQNANVVQYTEAGISADREVIAFCFLNLPSENFIDYALTMSFSGMLDIDGIRRRPEPGGIASATRTHLPGPAF